jgi:PEP-CTERM motif-containing protein
MRILTRKLSLAGALALVLGLPGVVGATTLTLSGPIDGNTVGPQSTSNPCIIAGTNCQQPATMGYNNFDATGNVSSYNMYSTTPTATLADGVVGTPYTVGQLTTAVGSTSFVVAIDVNTTSANSEVLQLFEVFINGALAYNYIGPTALAPVNQNGNGFADWTLGVINLAGLSANTTVLFHAVWSGAVDGAESFFLVGTTPEGNPIPEPASLLLLGSGLSGWALARRRKKMATATK